MKSFKKIVHDLITAHTPRCREITRLVSESMDGKLPLGMRLKVRLHFLVCIWCDRYFRHLEFLHEAAPGVEQHIVPHTLPSDARGRIKANLQKAA